MKEKSEKMEFLTPDLIDKFTEEEMEDGTFKIKFADSYAIAKVESSKAGLNLKIIEMDARNDFQLKKLNGYMIFNKLMPKSDF